MQQLSSIIDFDQIKSQKDASNAYKKALRYIYNDEKSEKDNQSAKRRSHEFLTLVNYHLVSQEASPTSKFYTLSILKLVTQKDQRTILSVLSSHSLLRYLVALAKSTDPFQEMDKKGKKLFRDQNIGRDYIRLILESIKVWGVKFSSNRKNQTSHYKRAYDELIEMRVTMPKEMKFYGKKVFIPVGSNNNLSPRQITQTNLSQQKTERVIQQLSQQIVSQNSNILSNKVKIMQYDINKINEFIEKLQGDDCEKYCHEYHKLFLKQKQKYESVINNLISSNNEKQLHIGLAINQFYINQSHAYKQFLTNNEDYYSYVNLIKLKADELNTATKKTSQTKQLVKKEVTTEVKTRKNNLIDSKDGQNKQLISKLKSKLNDKSQYETRSFKDVKDSLSKDKSLNRTKRSISGLKKSSISKFGKSITKSRISQVFLNPPNPYPQDKRYQGQPIDKNRELQKTMKQITKNQGLRRFITSNFKTKNPLFEDSHIQIGFKSQAIYEQVNEFRVILSIELFIGNKTDDEIINLSIQYKGDSNVLLYGNPKIIQTYLSPGYQTKHELLIVPLEIKTSFIKMFLRYQINGEFKEQKIILPNSIIKLSQNGKLSKKEFVQHWNASTIFKTQQFKLTRFISPDSLSKYIGCLQELSSYDQFLQPGSQTDFQLGCLVVLKKRYEGVLRISIRPNLNAVIQIGITDRSEQANLGFIHYAQTLQMLLRHQDHSS